MIFSLSFFFFFFSGGMFEYVSGANFFGESLEWSGFALMCGTLPALAFAVFTVCNIGPRACQHHRSVGHCWLRLWFTVGDVL